MENAYLHIRPQNWFHDPVEIVGNRCGVFALRMAVDLALENKVGEQTAFASDGEGYKIKVRVSSTISGIGQPFYLEEFCDRAARQRLQELLGHHRLFLRQNKEALAALRWCRANGNPHIDTTPTKGAQ